MGKSSNTSSYYLISFTGRDCINLERRFKVDRVDAVKSSTSRNALQRIFANCTNCNTKIGEFKPKMTTQHKNKCIIVRFLVAYFLSPYVLSTELTHQQKHFLYRRLHHRDLRSSLKHNEYSSNTSPEQKFGKQC